jgi:hypothetical protein
LSTRLNILPDPAFLELRPKLVDRLARIGAEIHAEEFRELFDPLKQEIFCRAVDEVGAHEGTIWLVDVEGNCLVPAFNTGNMAQKFVGKFKQPLDSGLISMVFASEQPFIENEVFQNPTKSNLLDSLLFVKTNALLAVPFYFLGACRGIISCVHLGHPECSDSESVGFNPTHLVLIQRAGILLSSLIEHELLSSIVGWKCR